MIWRVDGGEGQFVGKRVEVTALRADGSEFPLELSIAAVEVPGEPVFTAYEAFLKAATPEDRMREARVEVDRGARDGRRVEPARG